MRLRLTARALRQFTSVAEYISRDNRTAARKAARQIRAACELPADCPALGRPGIRGGTREFCIGDLPHAIMHRVTGDEVIGLAI